MPSRPRLAIVAVMLAVCSAARAAEVPESRVKAAIVSKFPQFVEWPQSAVDGRPTLEICVGSPDPFGPELAELLTGERFQGRPLVLRKVSAPRDVSGCHVLFVPSRPNGERHPLLVAAQSLPVLTVGDDPRFLDKGGIIALRVVEGRVRFEIDDAAARRVGLRISSQLLQLAVAVRGGTA